MHNTLKETGHSVMSILTSLHKPVQLYARLNMNSYRAGLYVFILTIVLSSVSGFFTFFMFNRPFDASPDWLSTLASFTIPSIPAILGKTTFFLVGSIILALIFRHVAHGETRFSVPFTIVSISCVPYYLLSLCFSWIFLILLFDPLNVIPTGYLYLTDIIPRFVSPLTTALVFCWYMARGILAVTQIRVQNAVLIAIAAFIITEIARGNVFLACHLWLNM